MSVPEPIPERPKGEIKERMSAIHNSLEELKDRVNVLEEEIGDILSLSYADQVSNSSEEFYTPMANGLNTYYQTIQRVISKVDSMLNRVEL